MFKREFIAVDEWLKDANLINISYGLNKLDFPLLSYINEKNERLFFIDTSFLIASLDKKSAKDLRKNRDIETYKGGIYENLIAEALVK